MKLSEFLLHHTNVGELVWITDCGWNAAMAFIDDEDLFMYGINHDLFDKEVKNDYWTICAFTTNNEKQKSQCRVHIVEV